MGWTIAGAGWRRAAGGVALALAALAGSHDSVRAQTVADSAGTTLSSPYSLTLAAIDGLAMRTRTAAGDVRKDPGAALEITPSRNTVTITRNTDVCDRTEQVRDEIVAAAVGVTACADVTDAHLAAITRLNLRSGSIMALAAGDFAGLTSLEWLLLDENQLTSLSDGVFAGLASLETLHLDGNRLTSLPAGVFGGLTSLKRLYLDGNQLTSLPAGVFGGLTSLEWLWLYENQLTSLPAGVFAGLTSLEALWLSKNQLTSLPAGVFAGLTSLGTLGMTQNRLTSLPDGVFAGLASLVTLVLYRNQLSTLSADVFAGLTSLEMLVLHGNKLTSLPAGVFAGLASLETLNLSWNATDPLPLAVTLEKVGESRFKAVAPTGAPFEFVLPVSAANGSIEGDSTAIRIPAGAVESGPLDITRAADTTAAVTVDIDSLPGLPSGHSGYALEKDSSLPQAILLSASTGMTLSVSPDQVGEEAGATTLTVTATLNGIALKADTAVALTVHALTAGTTDFTADTVTLTIASGQTSGTADLTLTPAGDDVDEGDETVAVEGAVAELTVTADTVTIADDDTRGVDVSATALAVGEGDSATYTVALESAPTGTVTVAVTVTGDSDVTASPDTLTFTKADWSTAQTVTVRSAADDDAADDAATVSHAVSGGDYGANNVAADPVAVTVDDDVGNHPATGLPAISGTARVGDTLTASVEEIEDEDGLENATFAYQWLSNDGVADTDIAGATDSIYTPIPADAGKTIKVRVTFADGGGTRETRVSAATDPVTAAISSQLSVADAEATEEDDTAMEFVVTLNPAASDTVTVDYATADGTATAGSDYTATSGTLTFAAGDTTKTISVPITDDTLDDDGETFTLILGNASGADYGDAEATGTGTINDNDNAAPLTASFSDMPSSHTGDEFTFGLAFSEEVELSYVTLRDTAFAVTGGEVKTAQRQQQGSNRAWNITVDPTSANDTVTITLPETTDCGASGAICTEGGDGRPLSHSLSSVVAGAVSTPAVSVSDASAAEGDAVAFTVSLSAASSQQVTVEYAMSDGTAAAGEDYTAQSGTLTFAANETTKTVSVATTDDSADEENETFTLTLSSPANATLGDATATGTINDNDDSQPAVSVSDASAAEGDSVAFTVSLSATSGQQVTVQYATSDGTATSGTDFTAESGTLTFAANETSKTVSVATTDDSVDEDDETFTLTLSSPANATLGDAEATGTIRNTETAAELSADFPESAFTSKRHTGSDDRPQVVVAFSEAAAEFAANTPSVSVTGASGLSVQAHTEDGLENAYVFFMTPDGDGDVTFALVADAACASGGICTAGGTVLTRVPAALTIPGPSADPSSLSVADAEATEEEDTTMEFVVTLDPAASDAVTVDYATSDGTATAGEDYTATSGTLTFAAGDTRKTISVPITDDTLDDDGETFTLTLSNASSGVEFGDAEATGTIRNTENAAPLTASFSDMPASHTGGEFTFGLAFSEEVELSYVTLRDTAFAVTGGEVKTARRQQQGSNRAWNITVEPASASDAVTITLQETTDCRAVDAICTEGEDGRPLSHSLSATVVDAASSTASAAEGGDVVEDALALLGGVTPDAASASLFGEGGLSEAQLDALDRLGNRNGRYDLGDLLSWTERCRSGEARCGTTSTDPGSASSALLFGAAAAGRRGASGRTRRRGSGRRRARGLPARRAARGRHGLVVHRRSGGAARRRSGSGRSGRRAASPGDRPAGAGVADHRVDGAGRRPRRRRPAGARGSRHRGRAGARSRVVPIECARAASDRRGGLARRGSARAVPRAGPRPTR
ncbi:Calx-beta domain-containing protein [Candidatus Palauibacter sp.]|uniref:Calx-beta domain-containing protein n=1 Tax=Candidatus Palauibacter sp. TaxID=3101350 RepID=UPI003B5B6EE4